MRITSLLVALALGASTAAPANETNSGPAAIISCPAKGKSVKVFDLSTGGSAPWVVEGPGIPNGKARATPIDVAHLPSGWSARVAGAGWVQALPGSKLMPHAPGTYLFSLNFVVKKGKRMPILSLTGEVAGDEALDLNLIEPSRPGQHISSGLGFGDETPGEVAQADLQPIDINQSGLAGKPLGLRPGSYMLQISVANGAAPNAALGLLAKVQLEAKCRGK